MIALVTNFNSFGLQRDAEVVESLAKNTVRIPVGTSTKQRFSTAIHFEVIGREVLAAAKRNIFVPNPEYTDDEAYSIACSSIIDEVWCKTQHSLEVFKSTGKAIYTGWVVPDIHTNTRTEKYPAFFHMSNKATYRGADELIEAWEKYKIPWKLTVVGSELKQKESWNVTVLKHMDDAARKYLLNNLQFYCSFGYEGFGYAIREAALCDCQIMTVDSPSTRDLGQFLIPTVAQRKSGQVVLPKVDPSDIAEMVEFMCHHELPSLRPTILKQNKEARQRLSILLNEDGDHRSLQPIQH